MTITRTNDENRSVSPGAVVQWLSAQGSTHAGFTRPDVNFGVISVQLVPLLEAAGLATAAAVWVASLKGVAQFGGRVVEIVFARNLRPITVGRIAIGILPPALIILLAGSHSLPLVVAFTLIMGASQGVITIVRGALPLTLFGAGGMVLCSARSRLPCGVGDIGSNMAHCLFRDEVAIVMHNDPMPTTTRRGVMFADAVRGRGCPPWRARRPGRIA